jgi:hypothetical protein
MQIGIDSFAAAISDAATGLPLRPVERMHHLLEEIELADQLGLAWIIHDFASEKRKGALKD